MPVAIDRASPLAAPLWRGRTLEWSILVVVLLVLIGVFGRQVRVIQGQAERSAVQASLGALRTALVVDHLAQSVNSVRPVGLVSATATASSTASAPRQNPFLLLGRVPANYQGEVDVLQIDTVPPGSWVFDPVCSCIGYRPLYPQWLEQPADASALWFRVDAVKGSAPRQISALEQYVWQGIALE